MFRKKVALTFKLIKTFSQIQWMKLKTVPINIILDEVVIEGETCENFRNEANTGTGDKPNLNQ